MHNIMQMVRHAKIQVKKAHAAAFFQFLDRVFLFFKKSVFLMRLDSSKPLPNLFSKH